MGTPNVGDVATATVADTAKALRESVQVADVLRRFASVQLHKNGAELAGPCPKCGGDDRFYITADNTCACRQCHTQRMDVAGLTAWLLGVSMHEAVDVLANRQPEHVRQYAHGRQVVSVSVPSETETSTQAAAWREDAARRVQQAHERLHSATATAAVARAYLESRGLTPDTWDAFTLGYDRAHVPNTQDWRPAVCWPVTHEESGETVGVRYRFLETQHVTVNGKDKDVRYTSLSGSAVRGRLFGAGLLWADKVARYMCLVITEGEFNAMSVWQACNGAGVDVLSFGSESQRTLPAWAVELASRYGAVVAWLDDAGKAHELAQQLPQAHKLRSPVSETGVKLDANELLKSGKLGGLVQTARLAALRDASQRESVLWQLWDVRHALDAGQVAVGRKLAQELGRSASWQHMDA